MLQKGFAILTFENLILLCFAVFLFEHMKIFTPLQFAKSFVFYFVYFHSISICMQRILSLLYISVNLSMEATKNQEKGLLSMVPPR